MKFKKYLGIPLILSLILTASACQAQPEGVSSESVTLDVNYKEEVAEYSAYSSELYETLMGNKPFILFFHARWCPICIELQYKIKEDLANFPNGTKFIEVNFDKSKDLKQKYGITTQATFVLVDDKGKATETLLTPSIEELKEALNTALK